MNRHRSVETARALNGARQHNGRNPWNKQQMPHTWRPGPVYTYEGRAVFVARIHPRYVISKHGTLNHWRHKVRVVYVAWYHGALVGSLVQCWCGATLVTRYVLTDDTTHPPCLKCSIVDPGAVKP
jgi:hypothetical protein